MLQRSYYNACQKQFASREAFETFPLFALEALSWSLAACWRAKCHTEQGVISHCALRVESGTNGSLEVGELRGKWVHAIYNVERVLHLCFVWKKTCWKLPLKPWEWSLVLRPLSCLLSHDPVFEPDNLLYAVFCWLGRWLQVSFTGKFLPYLNGVKQRDSSSLF